MADTAFWFSFFFSFGVSACCGARAGLCLLGVSILAHLGWLWLDPNFSFMSDGRFIALVFLAAVIEIIVDKFGVSSRVLDSFGLVLRTSIAIWLAFSIITCSYWIGLVIAGVAVGGLTSLLVNLAKPLVRLWLIDLVPGLTFVGTLLISSLEDLVICSLLAAIFWCPWIGLVCGVVSILFALAVVGLFVRQGGNLPRWYWNRLYLREVEH
ncbi:MAG: DUF4126 domain-containing protein [Candidatus Bruticola sp.]